MSERLPSIDGDISSGAVVFGNPEKKARSWDQADLAYITPSLTDKLYGVLSLEQRSSETSLRSNTFQNIYFLLSA